MYYTRNEDAPTYVHLVFFTLHRVDCLHIVCHVACNARGGTTTRDTEAHVDHGFMLSKEGNVGHLLE